MAWRASQRTTAKEIDMRRSRACWVNLGCTLSFSGKCLDDSSKLWYLSLATVQYYGLSGLSCVWLKDNSKCSVPLERNIWSTEVQPCGTQAAFKSKLGCTEPSFFKCKITPITYDQTKHYELAFGSCLGHQCSKKLREKCKMLAEWKLLGL